MNDQIELARVLSPALIANDLVLPGEMAGNRGQWPAKDSL